MNYYQISVTSLAKAAVFDLLAIYPIKYALGSPFPTYTKLAQTAVVAILSYAVRSYIREYNEEIKIPYVDASVGVEYKNVAGGCLGNAFKYVVRSLPEEATPTGIMKNTLSGCLLNGALYEAGSDKKLDIIAGATAPIYIEFFEEFAKSLIVGDDGIIQNSLIGLGVGALLWGIDKLIYTPVDDYLYNTTSCYGECVVNNEAVH